MSVKPIQHPARNVAVAVVVELQVIIPVIIPVAELTPWTSSIVLVPKKDGFLQRCMASEGIGWDDEVSSETCDKVRGIVTRLSEEGDPVCGRRPVDVRQPAVLWADASGLALGVALQIMCELDAVIKGVNLRLKWGVTESESATGGFQPEQSGSAHSRA